VNNPENFVGIRTVRHGVIEFWRFAGRVYARFMRWQWHSGAFIPTAQGMIAIKKPEIVERLLDNLAIVD
jgi:hypothetical protein